MLKKLHFRRLTFDIFISIEEFRAIFFIRIFEKIVTSTIHGDPLPK